jgi:predicted cation transporter
MIIILTRRFLFHDIDYKICSAFHIGLGGVATDVNPITSPLDADTVAKLNDSLLFDLSLVSLS